MATFDNKITNKLVQFRSTLNIRDKIIIEYNNNNNNKWEKSPDIYIYKEKSYVLFWKSETNKWNKQLDSIRENVKYRRWTRVQER